MFARTRQRGCVALRCKNKTFRAKRHARQRNANDCEVYANVYAFHMTMYIWVWAPRSEPLSKRVCISQTSITGRRMTCVNMHLHNARHSRSHSFWSRALFWNHVPLAGGSVQHGGTIMELNECAPCTLVSDAHAVAAWQVI